MPQNRPSARRPQGTAWPCPPRRAAAIAGTARPHASFDGAASPHTVTARQSRRDSLGETVTARQLRRGSHGETVTARQSRRGSYGETVTARQSRRDSRGETVTARQSRRDSHGEKVNVQKVTARPRPRGNGDGLPDGLAFEKAQARGSAKTRRDPRGEGGEGKLDKTGTFAEKMAGGRVSTACMNLTTWRGRCRDSSTACARPLPANRSYFHVSCLCSDMHVHFLNGDGYGVETEALFRCEVWRRRTSAHWMREMC